MSSALESASAIVQRYVSLSTGMRFDEKRTYWDLDEPTPVLVPEEEAEPLVGWPRINAYWQQSQSALSSLHSRTSNLILTEVSDDTALATYKLIWEAEVNAPFLGGAPIAAHVRVTTALRRRMGGWRIFASLEAHVDGTAFLRQMYRAR